MIKEYRGRPYHTGDRSAESTAAQGKTQGAGHRPGHKAQPPRTAQRTQHEARLEALSYKAFTAFKRGKAYPPPLRRRNTAGAEARRPGGRAQRKEGRPGGETLKVLPGLKIGCEARKARYFAP